MSTENVDQNFLCQNKIESEFTLNTFKESDTNLLLSVEKKEIKIQQLAHEYNINTRKLTWKLDLWVILPFCLLYFLAFLDRVNVSNAKIYGIENDLHLHGTQFDTALTVFFVPYVVLEVFTTHVLRFIKPHIWLSLMIFLFGIVTICVAFSHNYGGLITCRLFLGIFEAGSLPSIFYIIANYYTTKECQKRFSFFFGISCLAGGCAGALAYRVYDLDGVHGYSSWQWIYIIEGSFTAGLAIFLFFIIADFPEEARFLNQNERIFLKKKLEIYNGNSGFEVKQSWTDIAKVFKEPMIYIGALSYFSYIIPGNTYAFFAPTIIKELGYTSWEAQRHSIYPWLASLGFSFLTAFISDKCNKRLPFALFSTIVAIAGFGMIIGTETNMNLKYAGCFLIACGLYTAMPILTCWVSLNLSGHSRKSVGTAFVIGFGNIGSFISTFIFPNNEAPQYTKGLSISLAFTVFALITLVIYFSYICYQNKQKHETSYKNRWENFDDIEKIKNGDLNPDFKYLY